ncbi:MAG: transcription termination factor Rho, partial [Blautia sp.]|nr:transcription termination factor Rho [Blautia sp.]
EKRVFPAIDIAKSGTRREDLLLSQEEQEAVDIMRKALNGMKSEEATENILNMFARTKDNAEFVQTIKKQRILS